MKRSLSSLTLRCDLPSLAGDIPATPPKILRPPTHGGIAWSGSRAFPDPGLSRPKTNVSRCPGRQAVRGSPPPSAVLIRRGIGPKATVFVGFGECRFGNLFGEAKVIESFGSGVEAGGNVAKSIPRCHLGKDHADKLLPAIEMTNTLLCSISGASQVTAIDDHISSTEVESSPWANSHYRFYSFCFILFLPCFSRPQSSCWHGSGFVGTPGSSLLC